MINITNFTCEDNPPSAPAEPARWPPRTTRPPLAAACSGAGQGSRVGARIGYTTGLAVAMLLGWLAFVPSRLGDHLFTMNDTEASWRGWQTTKVRGGLGRRYRHPLFDDLAECSGSLPCMPGSDTTVRSDK